MLPDSLKQILKENSRSFYLSLAILPSSLRFSVSLAYLLARIADTIADTEAVPLAQRSTILTQFQNALREEHPIDFLTTLDLANMPAKEAQLLRSTKSALSILKELETSSRILVKKIVHTLTDGMLENLTQFPTTSFQNLYSLSNEKELEHYCYYAAGCVGEFWTEISILKVAKFRNLSQSKMKQWGKSFGEGLQLINILQDLPGDLEEGRCYLPKDLLEHYQVNPEDLKEPAAQLKIKPLLDDLNQLAEQKLMAGISYLESIPTGEIRLRLACAWPLLIGWETLMQLKKHSNLLDVEKRIKIKRKTVYQILVKTLITFSWNKGSRWCFKKYGVKITGGKPFQAPIRVFKNS